jgi:hypothetical protein
MHLHSVSNTYIISEKLHKFMVCGTKIIVEKNKYIVCFFNYGFIYYKNIVNVT